MIEFLRLWSVAFGITLVLEQLVLLTAAGLDKGGDPSRTLDVQSVLRWAAAVCFANICTHPAVWLILPDLGQALHWSRSTYLLVAESWAFVAEALLYWLIFPTLGPVRCAFRSALANLASWQAGEFLLRLWMD